MPRESGKRRRRRGGQMHTRLRLKQQGKFHTSTRFHDREVVVSYGALPEAPAGPPVARTFGECPMLSVVTGTYGRLGSLQRMVASVRTSLLPTTPYEIVVVDGGSTDGTQAWCAAQPDIVLLAGDLEGAVPNFNKGFARSRGGYVCAANDDIEFVSATLQWCLNFMQIHPRVGVGCIPHALPPHEPAWVSLIDVSVGGVVKQWPMAQVGIIPRWLGDRLGWWGSITSMYHGDEILSRKIWESGFTVTIVPDAWVRDYHVDDELRKRNAKLARGKTDAEAFKRAYPSIPQVLSKPYLGVSVGLPPDRPDVDIVLGTYNRLELLQKCIASHRRVAQGLKHRFVVVDGGSVDGTLEWLRSQPDVVLLECGVLDGAVRAFNRGFARCTADYVVNVNDDMVIEGSLKAARDYLASHPDVGQLAFPKADVGKPHTTHTCLDRLFANFGMTRRWLGDYVGWWGSWTEKYFGDVHCSLKIWELGYTVEVSQACKCTDYLPDDALRGPAGGDVLCKRESELFHRRWSTRGEKNKRYVRVPGKRLVEKADFE